MNAIVEELLAGEKRQTGELEHHVRGAGLALAYWPITTVTARRFLA